MIQKSSSYFVNPMISQSEITLANRVRFAIESLRTMSAEIWLVTPDNTILCFPERERPYVVGLEKCLRSGAFVDTNALASLLENCANVSMGVR